jgi:prolyl-tRNA synthetase
VAESIRSHKFHDKNITVFVDKRDIRGGEKNWDWIKKGVPLRIEVGPKDMENKCAMVARRDKPHKEKEKMAIESIGANIPHLLEEIQMNYFSQAKQIRDTNIRSDITTLEEMKQYFTPKNSDKPEIHGGFVSAKWCGDEATEELLKEMKITIRCLPLKQSGTEGKCILTGKPATQDAIFAKSYSHCGN